jgi:hypothetical protein
MWSWRNGFRANSNAQKTLHCGPLNIAWQHFHLIQAFVTIQDISFKFKIGTAMLRHILGSTTLVVTAEAIDGTGTFSYDSHLGIAPVPRL